MTQKQVVTYPTPPYSNPPITPQFYIPNKFFILGITMGPTTVVTTTIDHNYVIGQIVRLLIPRIFSSISSGVVIQIPNCTQLNEQEGTVVSIPASNQVELDISSIGVDAFVTSTQPTQPQIVATGNYNSGFINAFGRVNTGTFIPGSFINISPL
jgi:hypothetical protein